MRLNIDEQVKKEKINKLLYKIFTILMYILIFILLIYICINEMNSIKTFNYEAFVIISESMEPEIKIGDIVIIKKVTQDAIKTEDIITFEKDNKYITHRVKEIIEKDGERIYITRGDNNQVNDAEEVHYSEIKGKKVAQIPYIGLLMIKISKQKYIILFLIIVILLYKRARRIDRNNKERLKKKRIEDEKIFKDK